MQSTKKWEVNSDVCRRVSKGEEELKMCSTSNLSFYSWLLRNYYYYFKMDQFLWNWKYMSQFQHVTYLVKEGSVKKRFYKTIVYNSLYFFIFAEENNWHLCFYVPLPPCLNFLMAANQQKGSDYLQIHFAILVDV